MGWQEQTRQHVSKSNPTGGKRVKLPCPKCQSTNTRVTSVDHKEDHIARYGRCLDCGNKYITRERVEEKIRTNTGNFKLNQHQVTQIGLNIHNLSTYDWADIYEVSPATISKAKERFLRLALTVTSI